MYQFPHPDEIITTLSDLLAHVQLTVEQLQQQYPDVPDILASLHAAERIQPVRVTRSFANRIQPGTPTDPLLLQTLPSVNELSSPDYFTRNPLKEQYGGHNLLAKYFGRVLLIATNCCGGACRFCFRRFMSEDVDNRSEKREGTTAHINNSDSTKNQRESLCESRNSQLASRNSTNNSQLATRNSTNNSPLASRFSPLAYQSPLATKIPHLLPALEQIQNSPEVEEVILSGGDPMMLDNGQIREFFDRITEIPHVKRVRIHSRMPIYYPPRFDDELLQIFSDVTERKTGLIFVTHVNHSNEIDEDVFVTFNRLRKSGAVLLQQGTLLKGVNDSADTLCNLYERLIDCNVIPYYLHVLDHVQGAAHFLVDDETALKLIQEIRNRLPGYAVPRLAREVPGEPAKRVLG